MQEWQYLLGKDRTVSEYYVYVDGAFFAPVDNVQAVETIRDYWVGKGQVVTYRDRNMCHCGSVCYECSGRRYVFV